MEREPSQYIPAESRRGILHGVPKHRPRLQETSAICSDSPLCFNAQTFQRSHAGLTNHLHTDADATICAPMLLGVADGVDMSQYGIDASEFPHELLQTSAELAMGQLLPDEAATPFGSYDGPIELLKEAYEATESLGSSTVLLAIMDNRTIIHGNIQPMMAVLSIGDCELLVLRRTGGQHSPLTLVFQTESGVQQGIDRVPIQVARVNECIDPDFTEEDAMNVIERASVVSCVTICEQDIVVLGSDGVFDNLFVDEIVEICNDFMPRSDDERSTNVQPMCLKKIAERIVLQSHVKTKPKRSGQKLKAPIGAGGKMDDTAVVVAEVVKWTEEAGNAWLQKHGNWTDALSCNPGARSNWTSSFIPFCASLCEAVDSDEDDHEADISLADDSEVTKLLVDI